jgi:hypothetical protein
MKAETVSDYFRRAATGGLEVAERTGITFDDIPESEATPLPVEVKAVGSPGGPVLVVFHGAVDQDKRGYPFFEGDFARPACRRNDATLFSICDPTLAKNGALAGSWFQGAAGLPLPLMIARFLTILQETLRPKRLVLFGGSMGGHAALLQSLSIPDCIVVTKNPIVSIAHYKPHHIRMFLQHCWPEAKHIRDLADRIVSDVGALYANSHDHTVIYLQNPTDHHFRPQAVRFLKQVNDTDRLLFLCEMHSGFEGHNLPARYVAAWIEAALSAVGIDRRDIANAYAALSALPPAAPSEGRAAVDLGDIRIATRLAAHARDTLRTSS